MHQLFCNVDRTFCRRKGESVGWTDLSSISLSLPLYTGYGTLLPSSSWSQDCDTSSSVESSGDIQVSLYTSRFPSFPGRWDNCRRDRLNRRGQRHEWKKNSQYQTVYRITFQKLTQFMLRKNKKRVVLIQILVKFYGELTNELGRSFDFLKGEKRTQRESWVRGKVIFYFYYAT